MLPTIRRSLAIAAIAMTGVFASVGTAHAAAAPRLVAQAARGPMIHGLESAKATYIVPRGATGYKYSPNKIKVPDCNNPKVTNSFTVTNNTGISQTVDDNGAPFFTLAPTQEAFICASGAGTGTFTLESDARALLTFRVVH